MLSSTRFALRWLLMRKIKDILLLRYEAGLPYRGIANALNIGYGTVTPTND
jgi:DNA-directed RNA polymerase specialized sigma24 family protein